jgi:hypothetical protein
MKNETENKKKCVQCKKRKITSQDKEVSEFYLSKRSKDGFDRICKKCWGKIRQATYERRKDAEQKTSREYYKKNKKKISVKAAEYYERNKEKIIARVTANYQKKVKAEGKEPKTHENNGTA